MEFAASMAARTHFLCLPTPSFKSPRSWPPSMLHRHAHASSRSLVAFVSASGAEFTGPLKDERAEKMAKRKSVAGVEQGRIVEDLALLADPDSCFCEFRGVKIHHKICEPEGGGSSGSESRAGAGRVGLPLILLHGFGASVFSWNRAMKGLAQLVGSRVLAFDRPAFGLTSRPGFSENAKAVNVYSTAFSVLATLFFADLLKAEKVIIVGHSAGSLVAVNTYFDAPERVAALILVAPAIVAPLGRRREAVKESPPEGDNLGGNSNGNPFFHLCSAFLKLLKLVAQAIALVVKDVVDALRYLYNIVLLSILRSAFGVALVRMIIDRFGIMAVKQSWYDSKLVTEHVIDGYTKPLRAKDWDKALIEFTAALLTNTARSHPPLSKRLSQISCPVLIVTGDTDRIVPTWNAERLARAIPGSCFEVIKRCGHLPHEEKVDEFLSVVEKFLQKAFGNSSEKHRFEASHS